MAQALPGCSSGARAAGWSPGREKWWALGRPVDTGQAGSSPHKFGSIVRAQLPPGRHRAWDVSSTACAGGPGWGPSCTGVQTRAGLPATDGQTEAESSCPERPSPSRHTEEWEGGCLGARGSLWAGAGPAQSRRLVPPFPWQPAVRRSEALQTTPSNPITHGGGGLQAVFWEGAKYGEGPSPPPRTSIPPGGPQVCCPHAQGRVVGPRHVEGRIVTEEMTDLSPSPPGTQFPFLRSGGSPMVRGSG